MKKIIFALPLLLALTTFGQDGEIKALRDETSRTIKKDPNDTIPEKWKKGGLYGINISQGTLNNWAAGGDDFSLSVNSILSLFAFYKEGRHSWDNTFDFNLGYVKTTSLGGRKNDDRIDLLSKYGYALSQKLNLAALTNFRTQLFNGYTYDKDGNATLSSTFMSPGYLLVSPGIDYKPVTNLSIFVSPVTSRWTFVKDDRLSAIGAYGVDTGSHSRNEIGAFASINYLKEFSKTLTYKGRLDLFSNYKKNPQNIDLYMTNILNLKLVKALSLTYSLDLIYDDDVRIFGDNADKPGLQLKSLLGLGLLFNF